ncbi:hypothetical protein V6x_52120 [Gimesia chilikensis]|uniref:Uncharacterized protein n=2 Tax=Gimesia TaxID=1649453 RepID=A0A6I6AFB1_9PLAN|nr:MULTISPECIES: hypothetical protein [Gimesia]QDU05475.1 hypothetical protein V6x_52120 [Gimesia chilikensis]QGQ24696.1 hypothetical protein F1728_19265 [Gimesia benthica]
MSSPGSANATYSYTPSSVQTKPHKELFLERFPEFTKTRRVAACFVRPNATCPVCGERVFYYQNDNGSRVFFDELGPPWPKHPCTETGIILAPGTQLDLTFSIRSQAVVTEILTWQKHYRAEFESEFTTKYGTKPWQLAVITKRMKAQKQVFTIAKLLKQGRVTKVYFSCKALPKCCKSGFLIAIGKRKISFIDTVTLAPIEITINRYRGAKPFLDAMEDTEILP